MELTAEMRADMLAMSKNWKKRTFEADGSHAWVKIEDLKQYVTEQLNSERASRVDSIKISVGTDSKFHPRGRGWSVSYVNIIAFRFGNTGTHLIARKDRRSGDGRLSLFDRLWTEVQMTVNLALWMREELGLEVEIHFDINPKKDYGSNVVYQSAKGFGESFGFKVECKPSGASAAASVAADHLVRNKD
jgi:predicted RNase H-related nuclease YkuK (DUF458 family)